MVFRTRFTVRRVALPTLRTAFKLRFTDLRNIRMSEAMFL